MTRNKRFSVREKKKFQSNLCSWFKIEGKIYPWRKTHNPYFILVSEVMLQQTQVKTVANKGYYENWIKKFPTLEILTQAPEEEILKAWEGLGYYNRARNLQKCAKQILEQYGEKKFPKRVEEWESLHGIGRYTAGAIVSFAYNLSAPIVDTNIKRILARIHNFHDPIDTKEAEKKIWAWAEELIDKKNPRNYNSALIELGQTYCLPKNPNCTQCPVQNHCHAISPEKIPLKKAKKNIEKIKESVIFSLNEKGVLLYKIPSARRKNFWQLPFIRQEKKDKIPIVDSFQYSITHHRVSVLVHESNKHRISNVEGECVRHSLKNLKKIPIASPYRKYLNQKLEIASQKN